MNTTKKLAPTDTKGTRIYASGAGRRVVLPYDYALNAYDNHLTAARLLASRLGWGTMVVEQTPTGYVFLNALFTVEV